MAPNATSKKPNLYRLGFVFALYVAAGLSARFVLLRIVCSTN
jgi:hypothetical protein